MAASAVYVGSSLGQVYALAVDTGNLLWSSSVGPVFSRPTVAQQVVYVGGGNSMHALRASDGTAIWNFLAGGTIHTTPAVANITINGVATEVVYFGSDDGRVYALKATGGTLIWQFQTGGVVRSSPTVATVGSDDLVFVGSNDLFIYALRASNGSLLWRTHRSGPICSSPVVASGVVYFGVGPGVDPNDLRVYAVNAATAAPDGVFRPLTMPPLGPACPEPAVAGGAVYVGPSDGNAYQLTPALTFTQIYPSASPLLGSADSVPAVASLVIAGGAFTVVYFIDGQGIIYAYDTASGSLFWADRANGDMFVRGSVAVANVVIGGASLDIVCVSSIISMAPGGGTHVYALRADSGALIWTGGGIGGQLTGALTSPTIA